MLASAAAARAQEADSNNPDSPAATISGGAGQSDSGAGLGWGSIGAPASAGAARRGAGGFGSSLPAGGVAFGSGGGAAAQGDAPVSVKHWTSWPNQFSAPEHMGGSLHTIMRATIGQGVAVGFLTASDQDFVDAEAETHMNRDAFNGRCAVLWSPAVTMSSEGCQRNIWISETPGGAPVGPHCSLSNEANFDYPDLVNWFVPANGAGKVGLEGSVCLLPKRGKRYYCNYAPSQAKGRKAPAACDEVMNFPIGGTDDNTPPRS
jgi:hypothetical protein